MADFHVSARKVRYHEDAADLFHHLGGTSASDSVLLESADIESKKNTTSMAVLQSAVRVTCMGQTVTATPLTSTGPYNGGALTGALWYERHGVQFSSLRASRRTPAPP